MPDREKIHGIPGVPKPVLRIVVTAERAATFWSLVAKGSPNECWPWTGGISANGYGAFRLLGTTYTASRVAWFLAHRRQPLGVVCHTCDNPPCCNPAHLFVGTQRDNIADMIAKGRGTLLTPINRRRVSEREARAIFASSEPRKVLAERYNLCTSTISNIQNAAHAYAFLADETLSELAA